ncbi:uncharacterized protein PG986_004368 [Apiospora aurea]|uniref:RBR-type E3 ubiquitin transferase n=1 Tax=Apiospora aurea TaxID=335848 RepID=A0ABR1QNZ7_9PEZI
MEGRPDSPEEECSCGEEACSCGEDDEGHAKRKYCILCTEHSKDFVVLPCAHAWCKDCLRYSFSVAYNGGFGRPPALLRRDRTDACDTRARMEHHAAVTAYCHCCLEFVPEPFVVVGDGDQLAACPKCKTFTCVPCGKAWHAGDCAEDADVNMILKLAKKKGWRQCPKCNTVIEHGEGCSEMLCVCGTEFCFLCGEREKCTCRMSEEPDEPIPIDEVSFVMRGDGVDDGHRRGQGASWDVLDR